MANTLPPGSRWAWSMDEGSVSQWIVQLRAGDAAAQHRIWERYWLALVRRARRKLRGRASRVADEEDVAQAAFEGFYRAAREGRFSKLDDRHDLWQLLVMIADRKAANLYKHQRRQKRGGGAVRGESVFLDDVHGGGRGLEQVVGQDPSPEFAALVSEEFERLFAALNDETLKQVALLKMQGYANDEIARQLDCATRTVERKLNKIRGLWKDA